MDSAADSVKTRDPERAEGRQLDFVSHFLPTACDGQPWRELRAHTWREKVRGNGDSVIVNAATASFKEVAAAATSKEYTRRHTARAGRSPHPRQREQTDALACLAPSNQHARPKYWHIASVHVHACRARVPAVSRKHSAFITRLPTFPS